jgi:hypothetical protein
MPDLSVDPGSQRPPRILTSSNSTNSTIASKGFESLSAYNSTTALGDTFARAETNDLADGKIDAVDDHDAIG